MTSSVTTGQRHRRATPCPICGGFDELPRGHGRRCSGFTNGDWCRCTREEHAGQLVPEDIDGGTTFRHKLSGECRCGLTHGSPVEPYRGTETAGPREIEATYDYRDEAGELLYQVVRFVGKEFKQRRPDPNRADGWNWRLGDVRRVLYRLPELLASKGPVYVVEGEKDVEALRRQGLIATCNPGGAGKWHIIEATAAKALAGRTVIVIADRDDVGRKHANEVAGHVRRVSLTCTVLEPPDPRKDVHDLLLAGGKIADLVPMQGPAPKLVPPPKPEPPIWEDEDPSIDDDGRPRVKIGKDVHRVIADLDKAIGVSDPLFFQRDHELVAIAGSRVKEGRAKFLSGTPIIRQLTNASLLPRITEHVRTFGYRKVKEKDGTERFEKVDTLPGPTILSSFLGALDWIHVRPIAGITECPTLRPDGTVMQDAGYDEATGYLYIPTCEYPRVDDEPTHSDAVRAYSRLAEVFCDFPYVDPSHRSAVVATILAIVARPAIEGSVPCMLFDASSRRSGKTLQVDTISLITSGRVASRMTYPEDDTELEKVLAGYALCGARMINFDNVERPFGGPALDKCITAIDTVDLRVLGSITMRTLTWRCVTFASGNNIRGRGDILERVLAPRLESPLEHPEKRDPKTLRHPDLRAWVKLHRASLVQHALTVLRAYCAAGRPKQSAVEPWGGFEAFTDLVAHALVWVGAPDPLGARRGGDGEEDPTRRAERTIVAGWAELCRTQSVASLTVSAAIRAIYPAPKKDEPPDSHDDLREAIAELTRSPSGFAPDTRKLGEAIRKLKKKPYDGMRIEPDGTTDGAARWRVVPSR